MEPVIKFSDVFTAIETLEQRSSEGQDELIAHAISEACELIQALSRYRLTLGTDDAQHVHDELADTLAYTLLAAHPYVQFDAAGADRKSVV